MRKVVVEMFVPAAGQVLDVFLPCHLALGEIIKMVGKAAGDISGGQFESDKGTAICSRVDGMVLDNLRTPAELDIKNGAQLMLI